MYFSQTQPKQKTLSSDSRVHGRPPHDVDLLLTGNCRRVGRSTMEIEVAAVCPEHGKPFISSVFVMAARDPSTKKAVEVPRLRNPSEESVRTLTQGERDLCLSNFKSLRTFSSVSLMEPQDRNLAGNVFGGVLIRKAIEVHATNKCFLWISIV